MLDKADVINRIERLMEESTVYNGMIVYPVFETLKALQDARDLLKGEDATNKKERALRMHGAIYLPMGQNETEEEAKDRLIDAFGNIGVDVTGQFEVIE